jgi:transcriptional regulator with XRE-family HTH domain
MILADKLIRLRKKNGWSQEELAEKMNVSRQAVSKWESAQAVPDLEKILQLGRLFGVTTDYLLKDELEDEEFTNEDVDLGVKRINITQANEFIEWRKSAAKRIAVATFLCIFSVIPLLILGAAEEVHELGIPEKLATGIGLGDIGLIALFLIVAIAVAIFVFCGFKNAPYEFIDKEPFETEYGVKGMVRERQKAFRNTYVKCNVIGTCICVISPVPLFVGAFVKNGFFTVIALTVTMLFAGIGAMFFIYAGVQWASMQKLLKEGEFAPLEKKKSKVRETVGTLYWLVVTAVYLVWSFTTFNWQTTWIVWPVAGVLFAGIMIACNLLIEKNEK